MPHSAFEDHEQQMKTAPLIFHPYTEPKEMFSFMNWHANIELIKVLKGSGNIFCGDHIARVSEGELFVINTNISHDFSSVEGMAYSCIIIDRNLAKACGVDTDLLRFEESIRRRQTLDAYDRLASAAGTPAIRRIDLTAAIVALLRELDHNHVVGTQKAALQQGDSPVEKAVTYINMHLTQKLNLDDIARQAGISKYYFIRLFKAQKELTPMQYLNRKRCEMAQILLASKQYTVNQISVMAGFESPSYFAKVFSSITGMLPSDYK